MKNFVFASILMFGMSPCFAGTESGGGGGVVYVDGQPRLMDLFTMVSAADQLPWSAVTLGHRQENNRSRLVITAQNIEDVKQDYASFGLAITTLETWSKLPMDTISHSVLLAFRKPLTWEFTPLPLSAPPFYLAPSIPDSSITEVAAFYSTEARRVSLSIPVWNQLNLQDQAGLLIHEVLRKVQLSYGNGYDDETLQRATAIYLMCKPTGRLNYYLFYLLNNSPASADRIYGAFDAFIAKECRRLP